MVEEPDDLWDQGVGYINADVIDRKLPEPTVGNLVLVCGPPGMMKAVSGDKNPDKSQGPLSGLLAGRGFTENMVYKF